MKPSSGKNMKAYKPLDMELSLLLADMEKFNEDERTAVVHKVKTAPMYPYSALPFILILVVGMYFTVSVHWALPIIIAVGLYYLVDNSIKEMGCQMVKRDLLISVLRERGYIPQDESE